MDFKTRYQFNPNSDLVGKGGFAFVYKAKDSLLNRTVALKFFHNTDAADKHTLIAEISKAIELEHPNLCRYYDATLLEGRDMHGQINNTEVGVMEYLDGGDIRSYLKKNPTHLNKLLTDVLQGLAYLHENNIIHRDLKPQNILIKQTPRGPIAKITDFGISKLLDGESNSASVLIGTIAYMAPEQFNPSKFGNHGTIDTNIDLWSFGVMVYELITNDNLFNSGDKQNSAQELMSNILNDDFAEQKVQRLSQPYRLLVQKCLVKNAAQRVSNAADLISILNNSKPVKTPTQPKEKEKISKPYLPNEKIKSSYKNSNIDEGISIEKIFLIALIIVIAITALLVWSKSK